MRLTNCRGHQIVKSKSANCNIPMPSTSYFRRGPFYQLFILFEFHLAILFSLYFPLHYGPFLTPTEAHRRGNKTCWLIGIASLYAIRGHLCLGLGIFCGGRQHRIFPIAIS
ncbi:uncharacterized protein B0T23DRAFT_225447 [Neurospora hispaniola]|uniref:Uncharacterized protein n=1 Tax=Neurospora hispaniola TaxID=588809 RepID=A0AAJ0I0F9_9PEZI|nr:hypothetical protein B0T23DRAFT_225447 [Neurospora hispaniola]